MEQKRSKGVTIFAWLIIIGSALNLLLNEMASKVNPIASVYFYYIISPVSLVAAVFLLRLKNWARLVTIALSVLVAIESVVTISYSLGRLAASERSAIILGVVLAVGFSFAVVYFFSQPKVKAQFK